MNKADRAENPSSPRIGATSASVSVVVPTYNEAANLPELARRLFRLGFPDLTLVIVDDSSPDGTVDVALRLSEQYHGSVQVIKRPRKQGLGTAYPAGFARALENRADYIVQMDADLSHAPEEVPSMIRLLEHSDIVIGSRYIEGGGVDADWSLWRRFLSYFANVAIRAIAGLRVKDATCGFKVYRAAVLRSLALDGFRCKGFGFQAEVAHACQRKGYAVTEHPIIFAERTHGSSKMSVTIALEAIWHLSFLRLRRT
jgi:dolichol-phosphate mannosyltransferase